MDFDKNNSRDAIGHVITSYSKYFVSGKNLTGDDLFRFILFSWNFEYWRKNTGFLLNFCKDLDGYELCLEKIGKPQIIPIESVYNLKNIVQSFEKHNLQQDVKVRYLHDRNEIVSVKLYTNRDVEVKSYSSWAAIIRGELIPIHSTHIKYTKTRDLKHGIYHVLKNRNGFYVINPTQNNFGITCLQGHGLHEKPLGTFPNLENIAPVFFCLKRLERLFVDKKYDKYYQMIVSRLRMSITSLSLRKDNAVSEGIKTYEFIRSVYEEIYIDDLPIMLLLKELEFKIKETRYENSSKQIHIPMRSL